VRTAGDTNGCSIHLLFWRFRAGDVRYKQQDCQKSSGTEVQFAHFHHLLLGTVEGGGVGGGSFPTSSNNLSVEISFTAVMENPAVQKIQLQPITAPHGCQQWIEVYHDE
jgi:hypothetical protein